MFRRFPRFLWLLVFPLILMGADGGSTTVNTPLQPRGQFWYGLGITSSTLAGNVTLTLTGPQWLAYNPDGTARNITAPTVTSSHKGAWYCLYNTGTVASNLVFKNAGATTIGTVERGEIGCFVYSGTAWVQSIASVAGRAYSAVSATDNLLASAGASAHVDHAQTFSIPASTLNAGSHLSLEGTVRVTDASGTDTLEVKVYIGGTTLTTTTAFDPDAADDFVVFTCDVWTRAVAGAAVDTTGRCWWTSEDGTTYASGANIMVPANLATNGALVVKVSSKWSATTASTNARLEAFDVAVH